MNKHNINARKKRQLNYLIKRLNKLSTNTKNKLTSEIKDIIKRIKILVYNLNSVISMLKIKRILATVALASGITFSNTASAQWFAYPIQDPFNLKDGDDTQINVVEFADFDNDGDYDFLSGEYNAVGYYVELGFHFQENIGSSTNPNFNPNASYNPYNLTAYFPSPPNVGVFQYFKVIDLDNDGDFDILSNVVLQNQLQYSISTDFVYYENIGTPNSPIFNTPITNPFGLNSSSSLLHTSIADLDNDGDLDLLGFSYDFQNYSANSVFIENVGSASAPNFTTPQLNQFGIPSGVFSWITLEDIDTDGDFDMLFGAEDYTGTTIMFAENTGSANIPQFPSSPTSLIINPYGLTFPQNWIGQALLNFKDLDGDGDNDLIAGTDDDMNFYFENVGIQQPVSYECINYSCVDPGTGNGQYTSMNQCQTACIAPVSFDCWYPGNCQDPGNGSGYYTTYADCMNDCIGQPSFDCINGICADPGDGSGYYTDYADCINDCIAQPSWDCNNGICNDPGDGSGLYTSLQVCQNNCIGTSIEDSELPSLNIFPNPVNDYINIKTKDIIKNIIIYDNIGRVIIKNENPNSIINIKKLDSGVYTIVINFNDKVITKKFIK